jgi:pimeloyl-ACP methyl ester carboxylesterase
MPFASIRGHRLYYEVGGEGEMVILLHGSFADADILEAPATGLSSGFRALHFDRLGHGRSADFKEPLSLPQEAADVAALADWFSATPVHLVSHDDGAEVAIQFALEHPERTLSLALIAPTVEGYPWSPEAAALQKDLRVSFRTNPRKAIEEKLLSTPAFEKLKEQEGVFERVADIYRRARVAGGSLARPPHGGPLQFGRLEEIQAPSAVLIGGRDDPERVECASAIANLIPGCAWLDFPASSRFPHIEESRPLMRKLMDFYVPEESGG